MSLAPCTSCHRHVRRTERACPFCGVALALAPAPPRRVERLGRAAIFTIGTAVASTTAGCGARSDLLGVPAPVAADGGHDAGWAIAAYGTPPPDAYRFDDDGGLPVTHYGGPPAFVDAGEQDAGVDADLGCCVAEYGGPPEP